MRLFGHLAGSPTGCGPLYANALPKTNQSVCVEVGLEPPLRQSSATDPPIYLRVAHSQSLNQMVDCDASPRGPDEEIRDGCFTPYQLNTRDLACAPLWTNPTLPPNLPPPDPSPIPDCIEANPGQVTSMSKGLRARFEDPPPSGAGCPPNLWDSVSNGRRASSRKMTRGSWCSSLRSTARSTRTDFAPFPSPSSHPSTSPAGSRRTASKWRKDVQTMTRLPRRRSAPGTARTPAPQARPVIEGAVWGHYMSDFHFVDA